MIIKLFTLNLTLDIMHIHNYIWFITGGLCNIIYIILVPLLPITFYIFEIENMSNKLLLSIYNLMCYEAIIFTAHFKGRSLAEPLLRKNENMW